MRQKLFFSGARRTNREGALLRYFFRRGVHYSVGRTNREGRSNRGSVFFDILSSALFTILFIISVSFNLVDVSFEVSFTFLRMCFSVS